MIINLTECPEEMSLRDWVDRKLKEFNEDLQEQKEAETWRELVETATKKLVGKCFLVDLTENLVRKVKIITEKEEVRVAMRVDSRNSITNVFIYTRRVDVFNYLNRETLELLEGVKEIPAEDFDKHLYDLKNFTEDFRNSDKY